MIEGQRMFKKLVIITILFILIAFSTTQGFSQGNNELIDFIQNNSYNDVTLNELKDEEFQILVQVTKNKEVLKLIELIDSSNTSIDTKALAIRALGTLKNPEATTVLQNTIRTSNNKLMVYMASWALTQIGGSSNYQFVIFHFKRITRIVKDKQMLFKILLALSDKYKNTSVADYCVDFLNESPGETYRAVYLFGAYGRNLSSEQVLMEYINSKDYNKKLNAIEILGEWYASPNIVKPFEAMLKTEKDTAILNALISGIATTGTLQAEKVLEKLSKNNKYPQQKKLILNSYVSLKSKIKSAKAENQLMNTPDPSIFRKELTKLEKSSGNFGSYKILKENSTFKDIFYLEKLRESIMLRSNKDALADYKNVTNIITYVRLKNELAK